MRTLRYAPSSRAPATSSSSTSSLLSSITARSNGESPSPVVALARTSSSRLAVTTLPTHAAWYRGVFFALSSPLTSAPRCSRTSRKANDCTLSFCPAPPDTTWIAVRPPGVAHASEAPLSNSVMATSNWPFESASKRAGQPHTSVVSGSSSSKSVSSTRAKALSRNAFSIFFCFAGLLGGEIVGCNGCFIQAFESWAVVSQGSNGV
jgi:hypothetical protein